MSNVTFLRRKLQAIDFTLQQRCRPHSNAKQGKATSRHSLVTSYIITRLLSGQRPSSQSSHAVDNDTHEPGRQTTEKVTSATLKVGTTLSNPEIHGTFHQVYSCSVAQTGVALNRCAFTFDVKGSRVGKIYFDITVTKLRCVCKLSQKGCEHKHTDHKLIKQSKNHVS